MNIRQKTNKKKTKTHGKEINIDAFWPAQNIDILADSLACSVSPPPKAFPTLTLPAMLKPKGN